ncbi:MAG: AI-2E family transporter [bacterium]
MTGENGKILDISWGTILKIAFAGFSFYLIFLIRNILVLIIFSVIVSLLFNPAIDFIQKRRIPRLLAVISVYVAIFGFLGGVLYLISSPFISETQRFSQLFPQYFERMSPVLKGLGVGAFENFDVFTKTLQNWLASASSSVFSAVSAIFGGIFSTITIFTIAFFLSLEGKGVKKIIVLFSPKRYEDYIAERWLKSQNKVVGWFAIKFLTSVLVGLLTFAAAKILGADYAISLSLLAGAFNIVPIVGPIVSGVIIFGFVALTSLVKAIFILIAFILIQQIEGNVVTPILAKRFVGVPPVLVLVSLLIGGKLWGFLGAFLAIPLAAVIFEILRDFLKRKKGEGIAEIEEERE